MPEVGQLAPAFTLNDTEKNPVSLSDFRGKKNVLLVFYPFALSPPCSGEFCTLRDDNADLIDREDVEVIGVSTDARWALKRWKEIEGFQNTFLSDHWPHGAVAQAYGTFDDALGVATRSTFLIDKDGIIRFVEINTAETLTEQRDQSAWRKALDELG